MCARNTISVDGDLFCFPRVVLRAQLSFYTPVSYVPTFAPRANRKNKNT